MQETRLHRTETRSRVGCQGFRERSGCVESLSTVNGQFEDCYRVSLSLKEVFLSRIIVPWRSEPQIFATKCLRMALSCFHTLYDVIHISVTSQFLQSRGTKTEWVVHQTNFSRVVKKGLGTRLAVECPEEQNSSTRKVY